LTTPKNPHGLGELRVRGRPQVTLAALLKALSLNVKRAVMYHLRRLLAPRLELAGAI
jgi:hypothetical protein